MHAVSLRNAPSAAPAPRPELLRFAAWLRSEMRTRRLTQNGLALKVGASPSGMSDYLRGLARPRLEMVRRMADALGRPLEELEALLPDEPEPVPGVALGPLDPDLEARIRAALERERERLAVGADAVGDDDGPVRVREPGLIWRGVPLPVGALVWLNRTATAQPGDLVRVGDGEPVTLRAYDPADDVIVTAVGWLVQIRLRP